MGRDDGDRTTASPDDSVLRAIASAPPRAPADPIPVRVAHFRILERLGSGGMGTVYRAEDEALKRQVAVKVSRFNDGFDREQEARFLREARAAASLFHANVAVIYQVGQSQEGSYIAMELIEGTTLRVWLPREPLPASVVKPIALQIACGLGAAHAKGIIHRDLKPENVMITAAGVAKILDFGLAKSQAASEDATAETEPQVTRTGDVLGTSAYMSPEQALGAPVDTRSDVFAFGIVLYEMLAGRHPFRGATTGEMRASIVRDPPAPLPGAVDPELDAVVARCLAKAPRDRFPDASAIARALDHSQLSPPGPAGSGPAAAMPSSDSLLPTSESPTTVAAPGAPSRAVSASSGARSRFLRTFGRLALPLVLVAGIGGLALRRARSHGSEITLSSMVRFAGGPFTMGRSAGELAADCDRLHDECLRSTLDREQPARNVRVSPFFLDKEETTNLEFQDWLRMIQVSTRMDPEADTKHSRYVVLKQDDLLLVDTGGPFSGLEIQDDGSIVARSGREDFPVVQITWDAAKLYCASRGKRLPTEAERELASRGTNDRRYPWGDAEPRCDGVIFAREKDERCFGLPRGVQPVLAGDQDWTPEGVHGLAGNASEWVEDAFVPFYPDCGDCVDPVVSSAPHAETEPRVFRGSSWSNGTLFVRSTGRARWARRSIGTSIGVRCALSAQKD